MSFSRDLQHKKILVLGAGVTGLASARALIAREAHVTIVDDTVTTDSEFSILKPSEVSVSDFGFLLISPGWKESHPLIQQAQAAHRADRGVQSVGQRWSADPASTQLSMDAVDIHIAREPSDE